MIRLVDTEKARAAGLRRQGIAVKGGSESNWANRKSTLKLVAEQLIGEGHRYLKLPSDLKGRHIDALLAHWKSQDLSAGTLKIGWQRCAGWRTKSVSAG